MTEEEIRILRDFRRRHGFKRLREALEGIELEIEQQREGHVWEVCWTDYDGKTHIESAPGPFSASRRLSDLASSPLFAKGGFRCRYLQAAAYQGLEHVEPVLILEVSQ